MGVPSKILYNSRPSRVMNFSRRPKTYMSCPKNTPPPDRPHPGALSTPLLSHPKVTQPQSKSIFATRAA